jgi:hypothetical protein
VYNESKMRVAAIMAVSSASNTCMPVECYRSITAHGARTVQSTVLVVFSSKTVAGSGDMCA